MCYSQHYIFHIFSVHIICSTKKLISIFPRLLQISAVYFVQTVLSLLSPVFILFSLSLSKLDFITRFFLHYIDLFSCGVPIHRYTSSVGYHYFGLYSTILFAAGLLLVLVHYIALFRVPFYSDGLQLSSTAAATQSQCRPQLSLYFV